MSESRPPARLRAGIALLCILQTVGLTTDVRAQETQPIFRASTDLIELVVFVVDDEGRPITGLASEDFHVTVAGQDRPVVLSTFVDADALAEPSASVFQPARGDALWPTASATIPTAFASTSVRGRAILLAFDAMSFEMGEARRVAGAIDAFASGLAPDDEVGLVSYPLGPSLDPTTDREALVSAAAALTGQRDADDGRIGPSDVIDWFADPRAQADIAARACPDRDPLCLARLDLDMTTRVTAGEARTRAAQGTLASIVTAMGSLPDPKILVVVTAGLLSSDRPGGRPDVRDVGEALGRAASQANVVLYGLLMQDLDATAYTADRRFAPIRPGNMARDRDIVRATVDVMADLAGGAVLTDALGDGRFALDRIARETRTYYLLTVDTREADRTGTPVRVTVSVDRENTVVRARRWVTVPRP